MDKPNNRSEDTYSTNNARIILTDEPNSYIASAKERMYDVAKKFSYDVENSISLNDFSQIFKTATIWVKLRPRKLSNFAEVVNERTTPGKVYVRFSDMSVLSHVKDVLREHRLKIVAIENNLIECNTPRPKDNDIEMAIQKIKILGSSARNAIALVKADSMQRLQAALKNEYITAKEVKVGLEGVEKAEQKFKLILTFMGLEAEKKIGRQYFKYENDEAREIHRKMIRLLKRDGHFEA